MSPILTSSMSSAPSSFERSALVLPRRSLFGLAALCGLGAVTAAHVRRQMEREGALSLDEFLAEAVPLAKDLIGDTSRIGQDRYLFALASLAATLTDVPVPEMRENTSPDSPARTFIGANDCDAPFTVLHWRMEPKARIGMHPHIYGNVVTLLLEGEVRIENYEQVETRDFTTKDPFLVRRVNDQMLTPGGVNLVSLEHGYMHGFEAGPAGARGLDITTRIRPHQPTPTLVLAPEPKDLPRRIFEGRWRHKA